MAATNNSRVRIFRGRRFRAVAVCSVAWLLAAGANADDAPAATSAVIDGADTHLPEVHRAAIRKVVVLPTRSPANQDVTGSYEQTTDGLLGGMDRGRQRGRIATDVGGIPIDFPIPGLQLPLAIIGGVSGAAQRRVQDFRDALTEDLANAADTPLSNDALATDVFWRLRTVPTLQPKVFALTTPIPEDTDAILYVQFNDLTINVQEERAIITTSANATLRRLSDGKHLYEKTLYYQDSDTLGNWTRNNSQAWYDYTNYARHYLGREISAELYERIPVRQQLRPLQTETVAPVKGDEWQGRSRSSTPTLAWSLEFVGGSAQFPWAASIDEKAIDWELEVYDQNKLVYAAKSVPDAQHTVGVPLEACKTYRWSVRPKYRLDEGIRFGAWMRSNPDAGNGNVGTAAATASAYIHDFASVEIKCGKR